MVRFSTRVALLVAVSLGGIVGGAAAAAENFRVDNAVYTDEKKEPTSQSVTIFHDDAVYDCLKTPDEVVVFEHDKTANARRFVLLNGATQTRAELSAEQVTAFVHHLRPLAAKSPDPLFKFLANPKFEERYDEARGELTLSSPWIRYRMTLLPEKSNEVVEQYREFSDWYARLNAMLAPGSRPPFARIEVNAALAQRKALASQVVLTYTAGVKNPQQATIRSTHQMIRPLASADLDRVAKIRKQMDRFKLVTFDQYRKGQ